MRLFLTKGLLQYYRVIIVYVVAVLVLCQSPNGDFGRGQSGILLRAQAASLYFSLDIERGSGLIRCYAGK